MLLTIIRYTAWPLAIVGLLSANVLFFSYLERGAWGWVAFEVVMIVLNCVSIALNIYSAVLRRRMRPHRPREVQQ